MSPSESPGARWLAFAASAARPPVLLALALAPLLALVAVLIPCHLTIPWGDQWHLFTAIEHVFDGTWTAADLTDRFSEHSHLTAKVVMLILARATGWSMGAELATSVALAALALATVHHLARLTAAGHAEPGSTSMPRVHPLLPVLSVLVFSFNQWANWLSGWQITMFLCLLGVYLGLTLLAAPRPSLATQALALLAGTVATFSHASGVFYWPAAFLVLVTRPDEDRRRKLVGIALHVVVSLLVGYSFFASYAAAPHYQAAAASSDAPTPFLADPMRILVFVFHYLGSGLVSFSKPGALAAGILGVAGVLGVGAWLVRARLMTLHELSPHVALVVYAVLSGAATAYGRSDMGGAQAFLSRYVTVSTALWVAVLVVLFELARRTRGLAPGSAPRGLALARPIAFAGLLAVSVCLVVSSVREGFQSFPRHYRELAEAERSVLAGKIDDPVRQRISFLTCSNDAEIEASLDMLRRRHLTAFK